MNAVLFVGPTIATGEVAARLPGACVRPPAARGDVYRAARDGARVIGLVDGYFEHVPSVWHKEVLYALEQGVAVLGSSSMGAIRAAELSVFGMEGVGTVYELMAAGVLDDDDVAVAHGPAEDGYPCFSTALVNIRLALEQAVAARVIEHEFAEVLLAEQKRLFYPERHRAAVVAHARALDAEAGRRLDARFRETFVDHKHADAVALVERVGVLMAQHRPPTRRVRMARTTFFERMAEEEDALGGGRPVTGWSHPVLEELQVRPHTFRELEAGAIQRRFARELAQRSGMEVDQPLVDSTSDELRRALGLLEPEDLHRWLAEAGMSAQDYAALIDRRARAAVGEAMLPRLAQADLLDEVRVRGEWPALAERAARKAAALREAGWDEVGAGPERDDRRAAMAWWRRHALGGLPWQELDDGALAHALGFADERALSGAVLREYRFAQEGGS